MKGGQFSQLPKDNRTRQLAISAPPPPNPAVDEGRSALRCSGRGRRRRGVHDEKCGAEYEKNPYFTYLATFDESVQNTREGL